MKKTVYYHDTDAGGVVYYANYLKYTEEARTAWFASRGVAIKTLADEGILFVVSHQEADYKRPVGYGQTIEVTTTLSRSSGVRLEFAHEIKNEKQEVAVIAKVTLVCVDRALRPRIMPDSVQKSLHGK